MSERKNVEGILAELGRKIDELISEAKQAGKGVSEEIEEKIEELKLQKEKLEEKLKAGEGDSKEKWMEFREHLNDAAEAIHKAFASIFK